MNYSTKPVKTNKTKAKFTNTVTTDRSEIHKTNNMNLRQARRNKRLERHTASTIEG